MNRYIRKQRKDGTNIIYNRMYYKWPVVKKQYNSVYEQGKSADVYENGPENLKLSPILLLYLEEGHS